MRVTGKRVVFDASLVGDDVHTVDVRFDGHRVWSKKLPLPVDGEYRLTWPRPVRDRLSGRTRVSVADTVSGEEIASVEHRFGWSGRRLRFTDGRGRWLAMTKWNRLGPVLEGRNDGVTEKLLEHARELVDDLAAAGHDVYMVGGTLLGIGLFADEGVAVGAGRSPGRGRGLPGWKFLHDRPKEDLDVASSYFHDPRSDHVLRSR